MTNAKKKLVHLFDVTQCVGCKACIVACAETNYPDMLNEGDFYIFDLTQGSFEASRR